MHDTLLSELLLLYMLLVISMWMGERQTSVISNCCFSILLFAVLCIRTRSKKKKKENVLFWCLQIFARWHPHEPKPKVMSLCVYFVLPSISYARLSLITNIRKMHWPLWRQTEFRFVCCLVHTYIFSQVVSCYSFWSQSVQ